MGLFNKAKNDDKKKTDDKSAKVEVDKKETKKATDDKKNNKPSMKDLYRDDGSKKTVATAKGEKKSSGRIYGNAYKILIKPLVTEKATNLNAENKYIFSVDIRANKVEIKKAIQAVYGIEPTSVNIVRYEGKKVRYGRSSGKKKNWKKAIITLPKGKTINIYEGV